MYYKVFVLFYFYYFFCIYFLCLSDIIILTLGLKMHWKDSSVICMGRKRFLWLLGADK